MKKLLSLFITIAMIVSMIILCVSAENIDMEVYEIEPIDGKTIKIHWTVEAGNIWNKDTIYTNCGFAIVDDDFNVQTSTVKNKLLEWEGRMDYVNDGISLRDVMTCKCTGLRAGVSKVSDMFNFIGEGNEFPDCHVAWFLEECGPEAAIGDGIIKAYFEPAYEEGEEVTNFLHANKNGVAGESYDRYYVFVDDMFEDFRTTAAETEKSADTTAKAEESKADDTKSEDTTVADVNDETNASETKAEDTEEKKGCGSVVTALSAVLMVVLAAPVILRKH